MNNNVTITPSNEEVTRIERRAADPGTELARSATAMWAETPQRMRALAEAQTRFLGAWWSMAMAPYQLMAPRSLENFAPPVGTGSEKPH